MWERDSSSKRGRLSFFLSVTKALARDCGKIVQHESLRNEVLDHMYNHCKYASFHEDGSAWAMLKQAEEFLLGESTY